MSVYIVILVMKSLSVTDKLFAVSVTSVDVSVHLLHAESAREERARTSEGRATAVDGLHGRSQCMMMSMQTMNASVMSAALVAVTPRHVTT